MTVRLASALNLGRVCPRRHLCTGHRQSLSYPWHPVARVRTTKKPARQCRTGCSWSGRQHPRAGVSRPAVAPQAVSSPRISPARKHDQPARRFSSLQPIRSCIPPRRQRAMHLRHRAASQTPRLRQHLSRPILIREISKPVGVMLIDCLQLVVVTAMAAENVGPVIDTLKPLPVKRPATAPTAA